MTDAQIINLIGLAVFFLSAVVAVTCLFLFK